MESLPDSAQKAKELGAKYYFTGRPCKHGHIAKRATVSGSCYDCLRLAATSWASANKDKFAGYTAAYRARNRDLVRENDRLLKQALRRQNPDKYRAQSAARYRNQRLAATGQEVRSFNRLPIDELLTRLQAVHGSQYSYVGGYESMTANAEFHCNEHNEPFTAHPHNLLRGALCCPRCGHMKSSQEEQLARFLQLFTSVISRDREAIKPFELDVHLPEASLAVEYCGMYWHSHGDVESERQRKNRHFNKYKACAEKGIRLITVFESEWLERSFAIKRLLRNAIGAGRGKLMARKCELRSVTHQDAVAFYERYHPQGGAGSGEHYGLYWKSKLVACMRFTFGANDRGAGVASAAWTLTRYATRVTVAGGASRLFKAFLKDKDPSEVKSFSDNRYFSGGMYEQLGFTLEEETKPDYQVWSPKFGLRPKSHYQRRLIPKRLEEHGVADSFDPATDSRTERDMTYAMGARRIYDCGKKRWVWRKTA